MKKIVLLTTVIMVSIALSSCSTVEGAGQDLEDTGQWIQNNL